MYKTACVIYLMVVLAAGLPAQDNLMFEVGEDTAVVESTVREARAAVPEHIEDLLKPGVKAAYFHTYGDQQNDDSNVQGYHKRQQDRGNDGYRHFDSYHKKDGDKYGYEINKEYGQENKAKVDVDNGENDEKSEKAKEEEEDEAEETKSTYKVAEDVYEGKKGVRAVEDYDGGYHGGDSGESAGYTEGEHYTEGDGESEHYESSDGESEHYEEGGEGGDGESAHYTSSGSEYDDGESGAYTAAEEGDDY